MAAPAATRTIPAVEPAAPFRGIVQQDAQQKPGPPAAAFPARPPRFAVPKKGRLQQVFAALMAQAGLAVAKADARQDFGVLRDADGATGVEALVMRGPDALRTMAAGAADMAVVGLDMLREFNAAARAAAENTLDECAVLPLGLARCRLTVAAPEGRAIAAPADLQGLRIATSFPGILREWLAAQGVGGVSIVAYDGGVEDSVRLGLADVVCDLVETGTTLAANGLRPVLTVMDSEAVLVMRRDADCEGLRTVAQRLRQAACVPA